MDITPTMLAYLGLPVAEDMDGRPVLAAFTETFLEATPGHVRTDLRDRRTQGRRGSDGVADG